MPSASKKRPGDVRNASEASKQSATRSETIVISNEEEEANSMDYNTLNRPRPGML
jgi:hypothetical protein